MKSISGSNLVKIGAWELDTLMWSKCRDENIDFVWYLH